MELHASQQMLGAVNVGLVLSTFTVLPHAPSPGRPPNPVPTKLGQQADLAH